MCVAGTAGSGGENALGISRGINCRVRVTSINAVEEWLVFQIEGPICAAGDGLRKAYDVVVADCTTALDRARDSGVDKSGTA
jgi:hypothetical protein